MSRKPKPYWKGYLKLGMATVAVSAFGAVETQAGVTFQHIHRPTGKRINLEKRVNGQPISNDDVVRGIEVNEGTYIVVEDAELAAVKLESQKTIELDTFIDPAELDPRYFVKPFYLAPSAGFAAEGFVVIRDALVKANKIGIAQLTIAGREWLMALRPHGQGMMMTMLRYADEVRSEADYFTDIPDAKAPKPLVTLAVELIKDRTRPLDIARYRDRYKVAVRELVASKIHGNQVLQASASDAPATNVIDFGDALSQSAPKTPRRKVG